MKNNLNNVTIIQANCVNPQFASNTLAHCMEEINFERSILFSHEMPEKLYDGIEFIKIEKLTHDGFSKFMLNDLHKYIDTEYCLSTNDDGYIINPKLWTDEFFEYDYIGAPWPIGSPWCPRSRVGNGGFVLKSKKLIDLCKNINYQGGHEDVIITNVYYDYFVDNGCIFAPVDVACKFSLELPLTDVEYDLSKCFGFHGKHTIESRFFYENIKKYNK